MKRWLRVAEKSGADGENLGFRRTLKSSEYCWSFFGVGVAESSKSFYTLRPLACDETLAIVWFPLLSSCAPNSPLTNWGEQVHKVGYSCCHVGELPGLADPTSLRLDEKDLCPVAGRGGYSLIFAEVQPRCILNCRALEEEGGYATF